MPHYRCIVSDSKGKRLDILKDAANDQELVVSFNGTGQFLISHKEMEESKLYKTKKRFDKNTILEFTDIIATLLKGGLTLQDALELCKTITVNAKASALSRSILEGLNRGMPFYEILKIYSSSFSSLYRSLIRLGEKTGSVAGVFSRMSSYLQTEKKIQGKLSNALWYPLMVLSIAAAGCFGIIFYVMPRMSEIFSAFNVAGDAGAGNEIQHIYGSLWISFFLFLVLFAVILLMWLLYKLSEPFSFFVDGVLLRVPLLGPFLQAMQTLDFSFAMEMLTGSGITVGNALQESASVVSNRAFSRAILDVYAKLLRGDRLSAAFIGYPVFPAYIGTWIAVGEKTGSVEPVFSQIRNFFQNEVEHGSERVIGMIDPVLTLVTGGIVLLLVVQFVLPIFSLYGRIM